MEVLRIDPLTPSRSAIERAAGLLQAGGLVAFPTETVYGLGANALDAIAVRRIFAAKGRPAQNPLIVHVADLTSAQALVSAWPDTAQALAEHFWPGPLTLVLPRKPCIPDEVTAGGATVGIRIPAHPTALALLRACQIPIAAPSANRSNGLSPTRADHVLGSFTDQIDLLLDAGPTVGGLESTVLDLTMVPPRLLRPGLVTLSALQALLGPVERMQEASEGKTLRAPGQMAKHYAPRTPLEVRTASHPCVEELCRQGLRVGWLTHLAAEAPETPSLLRITLPADSVSYSAQLYAALHQLDAAGLDRILVERPPDDEAWLAVHDRLLRAAASDQLE